MTESDLRRELADVAARAIPDGSPPPTDILAALAARKRPRRWFGRPARFRAALGIAIVGMALATAGALAMSGGTFPVRINLVSLPQPGGNGAQVKDGPAPSDAASDAPKQGAAQASPTDSDDQAAAVRKRRYSASGAPVYPPAVPKTTPETMTLAQAEASFGGHVLAATEPGAQLQSVAFAAADTQPLLGPANPAPTVSLQYELGASATSRGNEVDVTEQQNSSSAPLTVEALNQNGPTLKTSGGLGPAAIETIDGGSYLVARLPNSQSVEWVIWKSTQGLIVTVDFVGGVSHDDAVAFVTSMT